MELPSAITGPVDAAIEFIYSFGPLVEHTVVLGKSFQSNEMKEYLMSLSLDSYKVCFRFMKSPTD